MTEERINKFWSYVNKTDTCWLWTRCLDRDGYAKFDEESLRTTRGARIAWFIEHGSLPKDKQVCHTCDVRACVRPSHLFLGTNKENTEDRDRKNRQAKGSICGKSRLTEDQVINIIKDWNSDLKPTSVELAKKYNVSMVNICCLVRKQIWKHLWKNGTLSTNRELKKKGYLLTPLQEKEIRERYYKIPRKHGRENFKLKLAEEYGVREHTIRDALKRNRTIE